MPRCAARRAIDSPSPGRKRMVIRSVAGPRAGADTDPHNGAASGARTLRIAIIASADSERPDAVASVAKRAFSAAEGRAVIEGSDELAERQVMSEGASAASADTSLSCRQSNFQPQNALSGRHRTCVTLESAAASS
jgi:hypothetical protein